MPDQSIVGMSLGAVTPRRPPPRGLPRRRTVILGGAVLAVVAIATTIGAVVAHEPTQAPAQVISDYSRTTTTATAPTTTTTRAQIDSPGTRVLATLNKGAATLLKGDQAGWLAMIDPGSRRSGPTTVSSTRPCAGST